ncbi:MAG TPA: efflux RND transporter periplasmic adaptor subunit [Luteibacter sp.]|uniref:efflux RND transporter periplasmic adaptor subunit n=1 Tax=Luteibacter sp. TaxID=1886636 RepID=UPI002CFD6970|nr:efflux RND transporter periplasmic adaptor subunit [Luteibacter sp.]HVI56049.1 efflux RND transporter periplasmic adaptor subunit [Luteibacter sp.]
MTRLPLTVAALLTPLWLSACGEAPKEVAPPRTVLLAEVIAAPGAVSQVTAEVRQAQRARLSFDVAGRIARIAVQPGDAFTQGQVLAELDPEPIRLRLVQARADASAARAEVLDRTEQLRQQSALFDDGAASQTALSMARAAVQAARGKADAADAAVALASRDLKHAVLVAPFAGRVVSRMEEPMNDIAAGQVLMTIDGQGQFEVVASLPIEARESAQVGSEATITVADGTALPVRLTQLSDHVGKGATLEAIFRTDGAPAALAAGQLVPLRLSGGSTQRQLAIPLTAVLPGATAGTDSVFVFDGTHGKVARKAVSLAGCAGERVLVRSGLALGDRVVSAGTAFLIDGQQVREFEGASQLETR